MTERKPPGVSFESWVDKQIREAVERGEFDDLPGAGKPLPGFGGIDDENWWLRGYLQRQAASEAILPTPLRLRKEVDGLRDTVRDLRREEWVREAVAKLNARIAECWRSPDTGRGMSVRLVNADKVVGQWREDRAATGTGPDETGPPDAGRPVRRGWWRFLARRSS